MLLFCQIIASRALSSVPDTPSHHIKTMPHCGRLVQEWDDSRCPLIGLGNIICAATRTTTKEILGSSDLTMHFGLHYTIHHTPHNTQVIPLYIPVTFLPVCQVAGACQSVFFYQANPRKEKREGSFSSKRLLHHHRHCDNASTTITRTTHYTKHG